MNKKNEILLGSAPIIGGLLGIIGLIALMYFLGDPTLTRLLSPPTPSPIATQAPTETVTPTETAIWTATPYPAPAADMQVCTGIPDGHLHVREKPGHQAPILGVLPESTNITPTGQRDGDWLEISAPLAGWVNSKYLCEKPGNGSVSP
jgi:hypothetical protein